MFYTNHCILHQRFTVLFLWPIFILKRSTHWDLCFHESKLTFQIFNLNVLLIITFLLIKGQWTDILTISANYSYWAVLRPLFTTQINRFLTHPLVEHTQVACKWNVLSNEWEGYITRNNVMVLWVNGPLTLMIWYAFHLWKV